MIFTQVPNPYQSQSDSGNALVSQVTFMTQHDKEAVNIPHVNHPALYQQQVPFEEPYHYQGPTCFKQVLNNHET